MKPNILLDHILESAIVASWSDLMRGTHVNLVHIEYAFAPTGTLDYMKVWTSVTRGHWLLACEYWMSANTFHHIGVRFENGYQSEELARILEFVMQHQNSFVLPANLGRQGLLQIPTPTEKERAAAAIMVNEAIDSFGSLLAQPMVA
ncbi:MAG TPA: hypothetical protein VGS27_00885 [Candidatus Sulfotelmatobacter sp.]|nr:hypothetical protein [Candidatus Sulfotelmatobacter sp.]